MINRLRLAGLGVATCVALAACSSGSSSAPAASNSTRNTTSAAPTPSESSSAYDPDGDDPGAAAGESGSEAVGEQEGSVTTADGAFVKYYDGLRIQPTTVTVSTPGPSGDAGTTTVKVTFQLDNVGTDPVQLDNAYGGQFNVDMTTGENRYEATTYTDLDGGGIEDLPQRLVPGTSATFTQLFEVKNGPADVLRVKVSPNPMLYDFYTFTDVETLIK